MLVLCLMVVCVQGLQGHYRTGVKRMATVQGSDYVKEQLALKQANYEAKQAKAARLENTGEIPELGDLELLSFIDEEGKIRSAQAPAKTRASVFAIYDQAEQLQYIGKSRDADQSLRTMLLRQPELAYYFRVHHVDKPSRSFLEAVADDWSSNSMLENAEAWENPLDIKPLMTPEDIANFQEKKQRGKEDLALKAVARRYEAGKLDILEKRGLTEKVIFDAKLKGQGLLDIKLVRGGDSSASPPSTDLKKK